jgi:hypothetical protein
MPVVDAPFVVLRYNTKCFLSLCHTDHYLMMLPMLKQRTAARRDIVQYDDRAEGGVCPRPEKLLLEVFCESPPRPLKKPTLNPRLHALVIPIASGASPLAANLSGQPRAPGQSTIGSDKSLEFPRRYVL